MERRMLLGIEQRAAGTTAPAPLRGLATLGFALAAVGTAVLLARRPRAWLWLAPPSLVAIAVVRGTGDVLAASAGFTALGLVIVGVPMLRRRWPLLLPVPAGVLLVLLLAPDAHLAFGLAFVGVAVAVAGVALRRVRIVDGARRLSTR
jgi:hypothetical protein